jgi:hypothetical protein
MSNKFLNYSTGDINLTNGTATIYANVLGADSLTPSMPIKTNLNNNLISTKLDIADINNLQNTLNSVLTNPYLGDLVSNAFIKNGGTNQQYLMADGSTLEASANSGNSNIYLYNNISNVIPPPIDIGDIVYNNINQGNATIIYISHLTRDGLDIERYYNDLTDLNYVYIQDQSNSINFIKYIITGTPTIITNEYIAIPVAVEDSGGTGATTFGNNHDIMLSFFSNLIEIDQRITSLESKTQNQTAILGTTTYSGDIDLSNNDIINFNSLSQATGKTLNIGINNSISYNNYENAVVGSENRILDNEQLIFGVGNQILSNISLAVGSYNNINSFCGNAIGRTNILSAPHCNAIGFENTCSGAYSVAIGTSIINSTPNSVCLGDTAISTIFPNSLVCDLGKTATPYKDVYISGSVKTNPANSAPIIYGNGNTIAGGFNNMYIGKNNIQSTKQNNNIVGYGNGVYGNNTNIFGTSNGTGTNIDNTLIFGVGCTAQANYAACFGNNCNNTIANTTLIGDPNITSIYPNSLICNLGSIDAPFKNIYYSGQLIGTTNPALNITHTATLFYNNITLTSSNSSFIPATALTAVGNSASQVAQDTTTAKGKLFKSLFSTTSPASFQDHGLLGTSTFLLNGQGLYIGMGFNIKISFGVADAGASVVNSTAGMFVGIVSSTSITWSASLLPSNLPNCIGIGHNPNGATINTYSRGSVGGDGPFTQFNTSTPDSRWFHLSLTNQFNSNIVLLSLTETISGINETYSFICGQGPLTPAMNVRMYPCIQRFHNGSGGVSQAAQLHFGQLTYNQLI